MNLKALFTLVRIPSVFSSMSNVYAGYWIGGGREFDPQLLIGLASASLLILAGMALNDVADRKVDARERPLRPIPSGAVSVSTAIGISLAMILPALGLLFWANTSAFLTGTVLCACIVLYNFALKGTALGPLSMGMCRALNVGVGISLASGLGIRYYHFTTLVVIALGSMLWYITLVTFLAKREVEGSSKSRIYIFLSSLLLGIVALSWAIFMYQPDSYRLFSFLILAAYIAYMKDPFMALAKEASPGNIGRCVGGMLMLIPTIDVLNMLLNGVPLIYSLGGLLWIIPAYLVGKWFYST